ncbi:MAG: hypothetical protein NC411_07210 [Bacteroides sp.]|nr:hypothetical protein [Bacteroides sp.]
MKNILSVSISILLLAACSGVQQKTIVPGDLYPPEYVTLDSLPMNVEVNAKADCRLVSRHDEYAFYNLNYPEYGAEGAIAVTMVDSARLLPAMARYLTIMEMRADTICEIDESLPGSDIKRWVFVHPAGKEQIQWMATDSLTMYVAGNMHFAAASDSTVDLSGPIANIKADILHMVDNLRTEK